MLNPRHICELISLESKVIQANYDRRNQIESLENQACLEMIYQILLVLNRQREALPSEEERQIKYKQALNDDRYIKSFWGSD